MSTTLFEVASQSAKSAAVRRLMSTLLKRQREYDKLMALFTKEIAEHRSHREGKPFKFSKAAQEYMRDLEADAREGEKKTAENVPKISDKGLLKLAFDIWDMSAQFHDPEDFHEDDRPFAEKIARYLEKTLSLIKTFHQRQGLPIPRREDLGGGGGISINAAFKREVRGIGTLGADTIAIAPVLKALDKLAAKVGIAPLSQFVNQDPEGLSGEKTEWFDATAGLTTVQSLLKELCKSPRIVKNAKQVIKGLETLAEELAAASKQKVRFHFMMLD
jgi:hypothetical protein